MQDDRFSPPPLPTSRNDWALFLDVDGTLAEFAPRPDQVVIADRTLSALSQLNELLGGAVAIVSGRPIDQIDQLFAPLVLSAGGLHGLEWRNAHDNTVERPPTPSWYEDIHAALDAFAAANPGSWIEPKGITLALHYRGAPGLRAAAEDLAEMIDRADHADLVVQSGKMIVEFRPRGADKGDAIARFLGHRPFIGRRPVFVGDDVTDENGFRAAKQAGGYAVRVGHDTPTAADWFLPTVDATQRWLLSVAQTLNDPAVTETE